MNRMPIKILTNMLFLICLMALCGVPAVAAGVQSGAEQQQEIRAYLEKLAADRLIELRLSPQSDFDKSGGKLLESIRKALPKYYLLKKTADQAVLSPTRPQMFFKYGDYAGVVELPVIEYGGSPRPVELVTHVINDVLPAYQNDDANIRVIFRDAALKVINKTAAPLTLVRITLYHNGRCVDKILDAPLELAPAATSGEISLASVIEQELDLVEKHRSRSAQEAQQMKTSFGFGVAYELSKGSPLNVLSLVTDYSVYERAQNMAETARLESHMAALNSVKAAVAAPTAGDTAVNTPQNPALDGEPYDFTVTFDFGKTSLNRKQLDVLDTVGRAMKKNPHLQGVIEGYTDNVGSKEANRSVSERRAQAAKAYLVGTYAIEPARIEAKGFGMAGAVADNGTPEGRIRNRRIEGRFRVRHD